MGKVRDPKVLWVDTCFQDTPEWAELVAQGHTLVPFFTGKIDLIISPKAQWCSPGRLAYVVKKLKDIVREVKG